FFILLSIIVPIGANGVRAYMIVMIGHLSGMKLAVGFDHLIYGWIFFGLVMFLLFWLGSFWREEPYQTVADPAEKRPEVLVRPTSIERLGIAALGILICVSIWPAYARYLEATEFNPASAQLSGFQATWPATAPFSSWKPAFSPSNAELHQFYEQNGHPVGLSLLYYRNQQHGAELISSSNLLVQTKDPTFRRIDANLHNETILNHAMPLREASIASPSGHLLVWYWYWIDGKTTSNDYVGKILQVEQKFLHGSDDGAAVMIFAPYDEKPEEARIALHDFLVGNMAPIDNVLASNKKQ
ncbi:MAG TPA: EpsI family protein, partial [Burkholderiaceae bacterium]|nr:EpsI family protein [Burkholderiaceae bacterium]